MASRRGPDNTVRISVEGLYDSAKWANVFWAKLTLSAAATQANLDTWTAAFGNALATNMKPKQATELSYTTARSTLFVPGGTILQSVQALAQTGTDASGFKTPANVALCVSWAAGVYWRGGKPRTYFCGIKTDSQQDSRTWNATAQSNWASNATAFMTAVNALAAGNITGTQLGFVSFRSLNAERVPPLFFPYTSVKVHQRVDTQRRRLGRTDV